MLLFFCKFADSVGHSRLVSPCWANR